MIVLVDMEWVENKQRRVTPTQLSAIRVDDEWEPVDEFHSLCYPQNASFYQWNHVAYSGGNERDFLYAPPARQVFARFQNWLLPGDVLLWWGDEAPRYFAGLFKIIVGNPVKHKSHSIQQAFAFFTEDAYRKKGSVYQLAKARGIPLMKPEHNSHNDVHMLRKLLKLTRFQLEYLHRQIPARNEDGQKVTFAAECSYAFQIDQNEKVIHKRGCVELQPNAEVVGYTDLSTCCKQKAKLCPVCCRSEWIKLRISHNRDIIVRSQCNLFFTSSGKAYHRPTCHILLRSSTPPIGTMYSNACEKAGYVPCKVCRPDVVEKKPKSKPAHGQVSGKPTKKRAITQTEKNAMTRFQKASEERKKTDTSSMSEQEYRDFITFTSTRYAFWAGKGYGTFHVRNCPKVVGLTDVRGFARYGDAIHAGFQPCRRCKPSAKQDAILSIPMGNQVRDNENLDEIIAMCVQKGFKCTYHEPELTIETPAGRWIVDVEKRPILIEHQHIDKEAQEQSAIHWQPRIFLSLRDVVNYISRHDSKIG